MVKALQLVTVMYATYVGVQDFFFYNEFGFLPLALASTVEILGLGPISR